MGCIEIVKGANMVRISEVISLWSGSIGVLRYGEPGTELHVSV